MPLPTLHPTTLLDGYPETWRGRVIRVALTEPLRASWRSPGQYCMLALDVEGERLSSPFVIANEPSEHFGTEALSFYVQRNGPLSEALCALPAGATLHVSAPQGPGFPQEAMLAHGGPVLLATNGSGLAGVRGLLWGLVEAGVPAVLYQGCRQPGDFPFLGELTELLRAGLDVRLVVSGHAPDWPGRRGYVQHNIAGELDTLPAGWADGWLALCGMPDMQRELTDWALGMGMARERICTNH
ncbi:MAG: hypothetical protein ACE366_29580 [Bradymonadia bacterium]